MSDYRSRGAAPRHGASYEPARGTDVNWAWIAGALALAVVFVIAFGAGHGPTRTASNDMAGRLPPPVAQRPINPAFPGLTPPSQASPW